MRRRRIAVGIFLSGWLCWGTVHPLFVPSVFAQRAGQTIDELEGVGVEEQLGRTVPLELTFTDEDGRRVALGDYATGTKPVVLTLVYHDCPMLCSLVLDAATQTFREVDFAPGQDYELVTVSIAPDEGPEDARRVKARYAGLLGEGADEGWHFLTGDEAAIEALARSVGFRYRFVPETGEYAHAAVLIFVSPEGTITRYLHGLGTPPSDARKALVEAGEGTIGTPLDRLIMTCYIYNPDTGSYQLVMGVMQLAGLLTVLALAGVLALFWRREKQAQDRQVAVLET